MPVYYPSSTAFSFTATFTISHLQYSYTSGTLLSYRFFFILFHFCQYAFHSAFIFLIGSYFTVFPLKNNEWLNITQDTYQLEGIYHIVAENN